VGSNNTFVGFNSGNIATGSGSTLLGVNAGQSLTSGGTNLFLGNLAGSVLTTESNNVDIAHVGVVGDSGVIRIGTAATQVKAFIAGVTGVTTAGSAVACLVDTNGQLGVTSSNEVLKEKFEPLSESKVKQLIQSIPVRSYHYKDPSVNQEEQFGPNVEDLEDMEIVQEEFPSLLATHHETGKPYAIATQHVEWLLLAEVQRISREMDALRKVEPEFKPDFSLRSEKDEKKRKLEEEEELARVAALPITKKSKRG